jgi:hypothetical protein
MYYLFNRYRGYDMSEQELMILKRAKAGAAMAQAKKLIVDTRRNRLNANTEKKVAIA